MLFHRPVFFMDNLSRQEVMSGMIKRDKGVFQHPMPSTTKLQMVSCNDIGKLATRIFLESHEFKSDALKAIDFAIEDLSMGTYAERIGFKYEQISKDSLTEEYKLMYEWFEREGYHADIDRSRALVKVCIYLFIVYHCGNWYKKGVRI